MKKIYIIISCFFFICNFSNAQKKKNPVISLSFNKTVHLFFNENVEYVSIGSEDILWKKEDNMVKLASKIENFEETDLIVKTTDNVVYGLILHYVNNTDSLIYNIPESYGISVRKSDKIKTTQITDSIIVEKSKNQIFELSCQKAIKQEQLIWTADESQKDVYVSLNNIFVYNDKLLFHFRVYNNSNINYDVDYFYLTIKDKTKTKKSTIQPINIDPIYTQNKFDRLPAKAIKDIVIVTEKFTVPQKKKLFFEMKEKDGGRNFNFDIEENLIYQAPALNL